MDNKAVGDKGEAVTKAWLTKNQYKILETNFHSRYGEVDIIASKGEIIAFVEVKTSKASSLAGVWQVTKAKQKKIVITAITYIQKENIALQPRFDVANVIYSGRTCKVDYFENAFEGTL